MYAFCTRSKPAIWTDKAMRDDFSLAIKELLAKRVAYRCSNPECRRVTSGPQKDPTKTINVGVAAHITAASKGGPRFNQLISPNERQGINNGIWLCQSCAKLVDNDPVRYPVDVLYLWKKLAETTAIHELENPSSTGDDSKKKIRNTRKYNPRLIE